MPDGKWIEGLTPEMPVAEAAKLVLAARFEVVTHFLPLAVEKPYDNPEYVHQLRVGTRRAGAALRVFRECLPRKYRRATRDALRVLRQAAGDARDWDVFRVGLPTAKALTAASGKPALDFLSGYAMGERSVAQSHLKTAADTAGPEFTELAAKLPDQPHEVRGDQPLNTFGELAGTQFGELLRAFNADVEANPTEPSALHQLRIDGKRVRYALEIFADCFPPAFKDTVYPAVEHAQELLGEVQDAVVAVEELAALRGRVQKAMPDDWPRFKKGFEGLIQSVRAKVPAGRRAFQKWRKDWAKLIAEVQLEGAVAVVTA